MPETHKINRCYFGWGNSATVIHACDEPVHSKENKWHICACGEMRNVE